MVKNRKLGTSVQEIEDNWQYFWGDHYDFWVGVVPDSSTADGRLLAEEIQRMFQEVNLIAEVTTRHANALLAQEPSVYFAGENNQKDDQEIKKLLIQTLENSVSESLFSDVFYESLIVLLIEGRAYLRSTLVTLGEPWIHCPDSDSIEVISRDQVGRITAIAYHYEQEGELWKELQYIAENGLTVFEYYKKQQLQWFDENHDQKPERVFDLALGGRLTIIETRRKPFISKAMKRGQNALNHAASLLLRNNHVSGFGSRIITNAVVPGKLEQDSVTGEEEFVPDPNAIVSAPGIINFIAGLEIKDQNGNTTGFTTPNIHEQKPIAVDTFIESANFAITNIYRSANQGHLLGNELNLSGRSRTELRNDFAITLAKDAKQLQDFYGQALMSAFLLLKYNSGQPAKDLLALTPIVQIYANAGKPSAEERRDIREAYKENLISRRTAISTLGYVDDVDAELERIKEEKTDV